MARKCEWYRGCEADGGVPYAPLFLLYYQDGKRLDGIFCRTHAALKVGRMVTDEDQQTVLRANQSAKRRREQANQQ